MITNYNVSSRVQPKGLSHEISSIPGSDNEEVLYLKLQNAKENEAAKSQGISGQDNNHIRSGIACLENSKT